MNILLWAMSIFMLVFACYMIIMNWAVFVNNYILKRKWTSAIPLIGGLSGVLGVAFMPVAESWKYCWMPLVLDWGSLPVIVISVIYHFSRRN